MCQCTLFDAGGVEIHSIECIEYCTKDWSNVEDVKDTLYRFQSIKGYVCQRCWRCKILWIIDQRLKIHTNMFLLITSLIFNGFLTRKKFWKAFQPYYQILCMLKHVDDVEGQNNLWHLQHALTYIRFDSMVGKP